MNSQTYRWSWLPELPDVGGPMPVWLWTIVGATSIPLWATWPSLAVTAGKMPAFQLLTVAFFVGGIVLMALDLKGPAKNPPRKGQAISTIVCALGLLGANAFFILSIRHIPAAQANIISYLWPLLVVVLGAALGFFRFHVKLLLGIVLGFSGVVVVIGSADTMFSVTGIILAGLSGVSWAAFCLFRLWQGPQAAKVLGPACLLSAAVCFLIHLGFEQTIMPNITELASAVGVGIAPLALANLAWDNGIRRGDGSTLAVMAYGTPLVGVAILVLIGQAEFSYDLLLGGMLVVAAGVISAVKI